MENSSYLNIPKDPFNKFLYKAYSKFSAYMDPILWVLDKRTKTILDVGCGQGYPMMSLKSVKKDLVATGVDLFEEYLRDARKNKIYNKLIVSDVRKLPFKEKTFDTVISLQVIEHMTRKDGLKFLKDLERIARLQVIVTTPLGYCEHPDMDNNHLQKHLSGWEDSDFEKLGYIDKHQGLKVFFDNEGLVHKKSPKFLKGMIFLLDKIMMPIYFFIPKLSDYWIIAYKKVN